MVVWECRSQITFTHPEARANHPKLLSPAPSGVRHLNSFHLSVFATYIQPKSTPVHLALNKNLPPYQAIPNLKPVNKKPLIYQAVPNLKSDSDILNSSDSP